MSSILWALWTVARSLVALLLLLLCLPFGALALAQFGPVTALLPFLVSFRATDSARAVLAAVVALTIVGFVLPLVVSGYPGAARPHVSRLAHGLIPVRIGAIVWRLVVLFWLVPVAILVGGEVVAAFMPHDRLPSPAADIARVAGFRLADIGLRLPAHADPGARLLVVGLWGVAAWGIANGAARLVRGVHLLHLLESPAYADTWSLTAPPLPPLEEPTTDLQLPESTEVNPTVFPPSPGDPLPVADTLVPTASVIGDPFKPRCFGLTIYPPLSGFPPRPVPRSSPQWPAYRSACAQWYAALRATVPREHLGALPSETDLGLPPAAEDTRNEQRLRAALAHTDIPWETKRAVYNGADLATIPDRTWAYYRPDVASRDPGALLLIDIEIDGTSHIDREDRDDRRNAWFQARGWYVARLWLDTADPQQWPSYLIKDIRALRHWHHEGYKTARASTRP